MDSLEFGGLELDGQFVCAYVFGSDGPLAP